MTNNKAYPSREEISFPNLLSEGKKYGLSYEQISQLQKYLNDKRMLRIISLAKFNEDARAWLSALTGIVADVLRADAHITIWLDKKLEKPRNWVLTQLSNVIPTKFDDIAFKAIQVAQEIRDNKILPLEENILSNISSKMHDKYQQHVNTTHLGQTFKQLKTNAKEILHESKTRAESDALKTLKNRKFQDYIMRGYYDDSGNFINLSKYYENASYQPILKSSNKKGNKTIAKQSQETNSKTSERTQDTSEEP